MADIFCHLHRDAQNYYTITGRMDDVINVTGHRLGTAEVEDVMVSRKKNDCERHWLFFYKLNRATKALFYSVVVYKQCIVHT